MASFRFEVVTPERIVVQQDVEYASLPGKDGQFGILANHAPIAAALDIGVVEFGPRDGERQQLALGGGFAEMDGSTLTVMGYTAELAEEIDVERAQAAKERAERRLAEKEADIDFMRAEIALKKALVRIRVASNNRHSK
jgi:F-type H+-transporting ATPase subunit epsilon